MGFLAFGMVERKWGTMFGGKIYHWTVTIVELWGTPWECHLLRRSLASFEVVGTLARLQSRDQMWDSSGTALASGYHNFVQINALWKQMRLSRHQKARWWFEEESTSAPLYIAAWWYLAGVCNSVGLRCFATWSLTATTTPARNTYFFSVPKLPSRRRNHHPCSVPWIHALPQYHPSCSSYASYIIVVTIIPNFALFSYFTTDRFHYQLCPYLARGPEYRRRDRRLT